MDRLWFRPVEHLNWDSSAQVVPNADTWEYGSISSWKTPEDPAQGEFSIRLDVRGLPQVVLMMGESITARAVWNGLRFTGYPESRPNPLFDYQFVSNKNEVHLEPKLPNESVFTRYVVNPSGVSQRLFWVDKTHSWQLFSSGPFDQCENYALCGAYASCNLVDSPVCGCLQGFLPKSVEHWDSSDWSDGCVRRTPLACNNSDRFQKHTGVKLPDTSSSWFNKTMSLKECKGLCLKNCSCTAYSVLDIRGAGSGCLLWYGSLLDIRQSIAGGQELYVRMASSELDNLGIKGHSSKKKQVGIIVGSTLLEAGMTGLVSYKWKRKRSYQGMTKRSQRDSEAEMELPIFDLTAITSATDNFSNNKLGEGGFGPVYKGTFPEGREIAVKRLSKNSGQGLNEFKNEVILIAKLQHRNLVKLLGCCIQGNKNMLIYEYMPNRSLDSFIFGMEAMVEDRAMELIDESVGDLCQTDVIRHIHVGLVCVQQGPEDRPDMSSVVQMLSSKSLLPKPRQPAFFTDSAKADSSSTQSATCSANEVSITSFEGR